MRQENTQLMFRLALRLQTTQEGLSLDDMAQEIGKSRRTAERFRDAVEQVFPLEIAEGDDRIKRWRIQRGYLNRLISFSPDELADLRTAKALMEQEGRTDAVDRLSDLEAKIQALMSPQELLRMDPDLEALTEAEGYAMRPGPRPNWMKISSTNYATPLNPAVLYASNTKAESPASSVGRPYSHMVFYTATGII